MSAATTIKTRKTIIVEPERRMVGLKNITVMDAIQTRAKLDRGFVNAYAKAITDGSRFPPVLLYRTEDGRYILADGFHRFYAHEKVGLTQIDAIIKDGTVEDAILAGIAANFDPYHSRKVEEDDRKHAAEMMLTHHAFSLWSDKQISKTCGLTGGAVRRYRYRLASEGRIKIPQKVMAFGDDGKPNGRMVAYKTAKGAGVMPPVSGARTCGYTARLDGRPVYLAMSKHKAEETLAEIVTARQIASHHLARCAKFADWMRRQGLACVREDGSPVQALMTDNAVVWPFTESYEAFLAGIGRLAMSSHFLPAVTRRIAVGYAAGNRWLSPVLPAINALGIEVMTPEEFVAEFGPKGDAAPTDDTA